MPPSVDVSAPASSSSGPGYAHERGNPESIAQTQRKRNRVQLSCTHCRHAKLKCDRGQPCSQCMKRGRDSLCTFPLPVKGKKPGVSMQNRLQHLESLVKGVMAGQSISGHSELSSQENGSDRGGIESSHHTLPQGRINVDNSFDLVSQNVVPSTSSGQIFLGPNESTYVGATHWAAILEDIEEVKSYFNEMDSENSPQDESVRPDTSLVFNSHSSVTKEDLLAALPERHVVDQLVYRYFNSNSPALHIIHKPTFQKDYKKFWADPKRTPISWLGLLYSLMCLATFGAHSAGEETPDTRGTAMEMIRTYRGCCAQCLVLAKYVQPGPYTLETFLIYMEAEFVLSKDDQMNCYLMVGVAVRLALRMGLHRDRDNVAGNISACQGELRRRIWGLLIQIDLLVSFHIGLPAMVQSIESDTKPPGNLRDEDFDEHTTDLPPSRPETEMTSMSYTIAKGRMCKAFGKVAEQANRLSPPSYDEVMSVDKLVNQAYAQVPIFLRAETLELSITDTSQIIIQRLNIALLFHKSRCVLHRSYITKDGREGEFSYARETALDASLQLLHIQSEIHRAIQPGGPLSKDLWVVSSLSMHDFLLASMIAYVMLNQAIDSQTAYVSVTKRQGDVANALERSFEIWKETQRMSADARKAYEVLRIMVKRVKSRNDDGNTITVTSTNKLPPGGRLNVPGASSETLLNESMMPPVGFNNPVPPLWTNTDQAGSFDSFTTPSDSAMLYELNSMQMPLDSLGAMIDIPANLDWDVFDNNLRPQQQHQNAWGELSFEDVDFGEH